MAVFCGPLLSISWEHSRIFSLKSGLSPRVWLRAVTSQGPPQCYKFIFPCCSACVLSLAEVFSISRLESHLLGTVRLFLIPLGETGMQEGLGQGTHLEWGSGCILYLLLILSHLPASDTGFFSHLQNENLVGFLKIKPIKNVAGTLRLWYPGSFCCHASQYSDTSNSQNYCYRVLAGVWPQQLLQAV